MLPVPELIKALYAAGLAWFVLAWVSLHTTAALWTSSSPATAIATTCRSKGQSNPDSSLESEDNNTWVGSSNEWNYQYCSWLGGDLNTLWSQSRCCSFVCLMDSGENLHLDHWIKLYHKKGTSIIEWLDMRSVHNDDIETSHTANTNLFVSRPKLKSLHTGIRFKLFTSHRWHWLFSHVIQLWYPYWSFEGSCQVLSCLDLEPDWIMKNESHNQNNEQLAL